MTGLSKEQRAAKLAKLCEIEGFDDETALFEAAIADSVRGAGIVGHGAAA